MRGSNSWDRRTTGRPRGVLVAPDSPPPSARATSGGRAQLVSHQGARARGCYVDGLIVTHPIPRRRRGPWAR